MLSYIIMFLNGDYKMSASKGKTIQYKRRYNIYISPGPHKRKTRAPEDWLRELNHKNCSEGLSPKDELRKTPSSGTSLTSPRAPQNTPNPQLSGSLRRSNALHLDKRIQGCQKTTHEW